MPERFSGDEARAIFARAARRQHAAPADDGLTLDDLVAIGREAGLDPALVAAEAAAARLAAAEPDDGRRARLLPTDVTDGEWERIVDLLRAEAGGPGVAQQVGRRREWAGPGPTTRGVPVESVRLDPTEGGTRLTVVPRRPAGENVMRWALAGSIGVNALLYGPLLASEGRPALGLGVALALVALAALMAWLVPVRLRQRARRADEQVEALLDRIDLAARAEDGRPGPRLDLDALADAPEAEAAATRSRLRT